MTNKSTPQAFNPNWAFNYKTNKKQLKMVSLIRIAHTPYSSSLEHKKRSESNAYEGEERREECKNAIQIRITW